MAVNSNLYPYSSSLKTAALAGASAQREQLSRALASIPAQRSEVLRSAARNAQVLARLLSQRQQEQLTARVKAVAGARPVPGARVLQGSAAYEARPALAEAVKASTRQARPPQLYAGIAPRSALWASTLSEKQRAQFAQRMSELAGLGRPVIAPDLVRDLMSRTGQRNQTTEFLRRAILRSTPGTDLSGIGHAVLWPSPHTVWRTSLGPADIESPATEAEEQSMDPVSEGSGLELDPLVDLSGQALQVVTVELVEGLTGLSPAALSELRSAGQRLREGTPPERAQAALACRRAIQILADAVFPPRDACYIDRWGRQRPVDRTAVKNRLMAFVDSKGRDMISAERQRQIALTLDVVFGDANKGLHNAVGHNDMAVVYVQTQLVIYAVLRVARA